MLREFQGNIIGPDGEPLDAFEIFGLPEEYRGRLFLIHVGKMAEYSKDTIKERIKLAMAA